MTLRERAALVGVSLRSIMDQALLSKRDREMRVAIAQLRRAARVELEESVAGRDRALDLLAEDR